MCSPFDSMLLFVSSACVGIGACLKHQSEERVPRVPKCGDARGDMMPGDIAIGHSLFLHVCGATLCAVLRPGKPGTRKTTGTVDLHVPYSCRFSWRQTTHMRNQDDFLPYRSIGTVHLYASVFDLVFILLGYCLDASWCLAWVLVKDVHH